MEKKRKGKGKKEGPICEWELKRLQFYELIKEIRSDEELRQKWVKRRTRAILNNGLGRDEDKVLDAVTEFFERVEILIKQDDKGKPLVRISPRKVAGMHYTEIMDVDSNNLASCISRLIDSAAKDLVQGYQKASTLSAVFGDQFTDRFNTYVKKRVQEANKMNWEGFDPVKAITDAQRQIDLLTARNNEYYRFLNIDRFEAMRDIINKKDVELSDLNDSGMMFIIQLMITKLNASILTLDAFLLTMNPEETVKWRGDLHELKKKVLEVKQKLADRKAEEGQRKKTKHYSEWEGSAALTEPYKNDAAFGLISDILESSAAKIQVEVPESMRERYVPFDHPAIERKVLGSNGLTVKQIGAGLKTAETPALGIAVTFQACLQLENDGRVVLSQLEGDVSVSPNPR